MTSLGDVDGDGCADYALGAWYHDYVNVYSGKSGALLSSMHGVASEAFGYAIADAGDVDGDGAHDLAIGAPKGPNYWSFGRVQVVSLVSGQTLATFTGDAPGDEFGSALAGDVDLDDDGVADLLVGAPKSAGSGYVRAFSGANGSVLCTVHATSQKGAFGSSVAFVEHSLAGRSAFVAGEPSVQTYAGAWSLYLLSPIRPDSYCSAARNSTGASASAGWIGKASSSGASPTLTLSDAPPGRTCVCVYGSSRAQTPFGAGTSCVGGPVGPIAFGVGLVDGNGNASHAIVATAPPFANGPYPLAAGHEFFFQWIFRDTTASGESISRASDALAVVFVE
jgi:hypothetical protein